MSEPSQSNPFVSPETVDPPPRVQARSPLVVRLIFFALACIEFSAALWLGLAATFFGLITFVLASALLVRNRWVPYVCAFYLLLHLLPLVGIFFESLERGYTIATLSSVFTGLLCIVGIALVLRPSIRAYYRLPS